jgi:hypothetical protein
MILDTSILTGIDETELQSGFNLYPNPARNKFNVAFNGQLTVDNGQLSICDITGREVLKQNLHCPLSIVHCQFSAGVYFVRVSDGKKTAVQRLVIQ